jgi:hypothetical protein
MKKNITSPRKATEICKQLLSNTKIRNHITILEQHSNIFIWVTSNIYFTLIFWMVKIEYQVPTTKLAESLKE